MSQPVFISYASRDKEVADAVCRALEDNGMRCWIAPRDILPGMEYAAAIIDALNTCQVFLFIFSETSNSSPQVAREVERAISKNRTILTCRIDNTALSKAMEYYLSDRHWMDASSGKFTQHLGNLVKAVKALETTMPTSSEDEGLLQKELHEAKAAEEKARMNTLVTKADQAIKSARWDEATGFLKAALAIKPDEAVEAKLTEVRLQQRAASLIELKTRAQGLAHAERFGEAIEAWNEYLGLKPDDHEEVERNLQDLRKSVKIAGDYEKSQEAIRRKHYDRAIGLLQGIIAQKPAYKDSSRLLSEALQAKKSIPSWRRHWTFEVTGVVAVILLGVFFGPKLFAAIFHPKQKTFAPATTSSTTTALPTFTAQQQAPATAEALNPIPALPADLVSLKPILAYVTSTPPDFADDFSKANAAWDPFQEGITLNNGLLNLKMQAGTPTEKIGPFSRYMNANNFWLEFDFLFVGSNADAWLGEGFASTGNETNFDTRIDPTKQEWFIGLTDNSVGKSGHLDEPLKGKWSHLLIIYSNNQVVVFLNGELLGHVEGIPKSGNDIWMIGTTTGQGEIWLDNVKFWNLDNLGSLIVSPVPTDKIPSPPTSSHEPIPALPAELSNLKPILNFVSSTSPDFEDDFSKANQAWDPFQEGITLNDGELRLSMQAGTPTEKIGPSAPFMQATNFWLEFYFYYEGGRGDTTINIAFPSTSDGSRADFNFNIDLENHGWFIGFIDNANAKSGNISDSLLGKWHHLQMVFYKGQVVVFLNAGLLGHVEGIGGNTQNRFWLVSTTSGLAEIWLDNLKFWDLDKIPTLP